MNLKFLHITTAVNHNDVKYINCFCTDDVQRAETLVTETTYMNKRTIETRKYNYSFFLSM